MNSKEPKENKLDQTKKKILLNVLNKLVDFNKIDAIILYGSQVSGYATEKSDYDVIVLVSDYKKNIRYKYIDDEIQVSAIIVKTNLFINDAKNAHLGEFAIGRLLNPYLPIKGEALCKKIELIYKKRIMLEIINELHHRYGKDIIKLEIPVEYFLFEKLKRRAKLYPPVQYSYIKTYQGSVKEKNLQISCEIFIKGIKELEKENIVSFKNNSIYNIKIEEKSKIKNSLSNAKRGIKHYIVHLYAGRISPKIAKRELFSKISRSKKTKKVPVFLKNPEKLIKISK